MTFVISIFRLRKLTVHFRPFSLATVHLPRFLRVEFVKPPVVMGIYFVKNDTGSGSSQDAGAGRFILESLPCHCAVLNM